MRKLFTAALGYVGALILAHYVLPAGTLVWCALFMAVLFGCSFLLKDYARLRAALLCAFAALGFIWYSGYSRINVEPCEKLSGKTIEVVARATDYGRIYEDYASVNVIITSGAAKGARCLLYDYEGLWRDLSPGDEFSVEVKLTSATLRYGQATDAYTSRGIFLRGYMKSAPCVTGRWGGSFLYFPKVMARAVQQKAAEIFSGDVSAFLRAMLIGDKTEIYSDDGAYVALTRAGIFHICAVSGMHLSFLCGFISLFARNRRRAAYLTIPVIWLFALMAGFAASVARSAVMLTMVVAAPLFGRESDGVTSLSAAILALTLVNPMSIGAAGLQLSFLATLGMILVAPRVYGWCDKKRRERGMKAGGIWRAVTASVASSVGAIVFTTPVSALQFGYVALLSPLSNLLTVAVMSVTFISGYIAVILGLLWTGLGTAAGWCVAWPARYILLVGRLISALPFSSVYTADRMVGAWLVFTYVVFLISWYRGRKQGFRPIAPICLSVICLCCVLISNSLYYTFSRTAAVIDVGQGECVAAFTGGDTVLVDCGGKCSEKNAGDAAAEYLLSLGRPDVDALVLTHLHLDHANGVTRLMSLMPVKYLFLPAGASDSDGMLPDILSMAEKKDVKVVYISEDTDITAGSILLRLIAPVGAGDENERGLTAVVSMGDVDLVATGDANAAVERKLVKRGVFPDCEILVVGHHGSKNSSSEEYLKAISAESAVIPVGYNSYGHPAEETLERLNDFGMDIYRTDMDGTVTIRMDRNG